MNNFTEAELQRKNDIIAREVDVTDPWVVKYRTPMVDTHHAYGAFVATLHKGNEDEDEATRLFEFFAPTEEDAELVGHYIKFLLTRWYNKSYINSLNVLPVDLDPGVNTMFFGHMAHSWVYNRSSWQNQPFFPGRYPEPKKTFSSLLDLIDFIETGSDGVPNPRWVAYKEENNV